MKGKEAREVLGVTARTLSNYVRQGLIRYTKINEKHYIYNDEDIYALLGEKKEKQNRINVTYSRVSLSKQKKDLVTQKERNYNFALSNGLAVSREYEDVKSGMNFTDRKGFNKLIEDIVDSRIDNIIIENKDRLCRFGYELFEKLCKQFGTNIIVTSSIENKSYEQELTDDLISIIHYFSMKSYSNRRKLNKIKKELSE